MTKRKKTTIGNLCQSRMQWAINPVTRKTKNKKAYTRRTKHKQRDYE